MTGYVALLGYRAWHYHVQSKPMKSGIITADPAETCENAVLAWISLLSTEVGYASSSFGLSKLLSAQPFSDIYSSGF